MEKNNIMNELGNQFPEYEMQIIRLLEENNDFREIAEDFEFCRIKLARLSLDPVGNKPLIRHYADTMDELKEEMKGYFSNEQ